jgi:formamidopyrimidine-DNA glycosylase
MIEIHEPALLANPLTPLPVGKEIHTINAAASPHKFVWYYGQPEDYSELAKGKVLIMARAFGGMVECSADDIRLLFSEGINLRFHHPEDSRPKKHQLLVEFSDGSALSASAQMYGGVGVYRQGENDNPYYLKSIRAPSPLTPQFDRDHFNSLQKGIDVSKLSAKAFLATEQRIPGLGNGVLQDILFHARIHPKRKMADLTSLELDALFESVLQTLKSMTQDGGRDTEKDLYGQTGGYVTVMSRNNVQKPCPSCGTTIQKASYLGGSIYFCVTCQPL